MWFLSHTHLKIMHIWITTLWFSLCDFPLMRVFTSPKMRISRGPPVYVHIFFRLNTWNLNWKIFRTECNVITEWFNFINTLFRNPKERNLYEDVISRGGSYNNHGSYNGGSSSSRSVPWYSAAQGNWNPGGIPGGSSFNHGGNPGGSSFNPGGNPGGSSFNSGGNLGGSSFNPDGNPGGSSFNSGGNPGGSSFNPGGNHGGSSFNPGGNHGGSSYNPSRNPGGSSYNPGGGSYNPGRNPGGSSYNPGGNPGGSSFNPGENPGGSSFNPGGNPGGSSFNPGGNPGEGTSGHNFGRNSRTFDQQGIHKLIWNKKFKSRYA